MVHPIADGMTTSYKITGLNLGSINDGKQGSKTKWPLATNRGQWALGTGGQIGAKSDQNKGVDTGHCRLEVFVQLIGRRPPSAFGIAVGKVKHKAAQCNGQ